MIKLKKQEIARLVDYEIKYDGMTTTGHFEYIFDLRILYPLGISKKLCDHIVKKFKKKGFTNASVEREDKVLFRRYTKPDVLYIKLDVKATCASTQEYNKEIGTKAVFVKSEIQVLKVINAILNIISDYAAVTTISTSFLYCDILEFCRHETKYLKSL